LDKKRGIGTGTPERDCVSCEWSAPVALEQQLQASPVPAFAKVPILVTSSSITGQRETHSEIAEGIA
jgi:hypothetical protein